MCKAVVETALALVAKTFTRAGELAVTSATTATAVAFKASTAAEAAGSAGIGLALLRLHAGHHFGLDGLAGVGFDVENLAAVAHFGKGDGQAIASGAAGTANAVGVILGLHGQTEVEHMADGGHVNTARGHIGCYQDLHLTLAQSHQAAVAQTLAQGTVQCHGREAFLLQVVGQAVALDLGAGKNDGLVDGGVTQPVVQQLALVVGVVGPEQHLLDVDVLFLRIVDGHALGFAHHAGSELLNARREGGAKHHGLLAVDGELVDFGQVVGEAQVQHTVGFVNHQELHLVQLDLLRALQIQQAAGCGDHQVGILQLGNLQLVRHATHDVGNAQTAAMLHQVDGVMGHLLCQFAGRANDQGAGCGGLEVALAGRVLALGALGCGLTGFNSGSAGGFELFAFGGLSCGLLCQQGVQHGQEKGGGLAATGLAGDHQVDVAGLLAVHCLGQSQGNGLQLDGGGLGITQVFHRHHQFVGQAQFHKAIRGFGHIDGHFSSCFSRRNGLKAGVQGSGKVFGRREFACHFKSVSHIFSHTRAPQVVRLLRQWLKNINHQTEPALTR